MQSLFRVVKVALVTATMPAILGLGTCVTLTGCAGNAGMQAFQHGMKLGYHLGLGEQYMDDDKLDQAEKEFKTALAIAEKGDTKSDVAEAWTRLAQVWRRQRKTEQAITTFKKAADIYDKNHEFALSSDKKVWLLCLKEWEEMLHEQNKQAEAKKVHEMYEQASSEEGSDT